MAVSIIPPKFYAWDRNGKPLAFGKLYTYQARTNTPKPTYQSEDQVVENTNPVILNGEGYANVYLDGSYKMVLKDKDDNEVWSSDPVTANQADEWVNCFFATYVSATSFKLAGNQTDKYRIGRKVRIDNNVTEFSYSTIQSSVYASGETSVVVIDPVVTTGINSVCTSVVSPESSFNKDDLALLSSYFFANTDEMKAGNLLNGQVADFAILASIKAPVTRGEYYADTGKGFALGKILTAAEFGGAPDGQVDFYVGGGSTYVFKLNNEGGINAHQAGLKGDDTDEWQEIANLESYLSDKKVNCFFPKGIYNNGIRNFPFRNTSLTPTSFKDYGGLTLFGEGKGQTFFKTDSVDGADVLQLNAVSGIVVKELSILALVSGSAAGSNGVSVTNGGKDIDIDVDCLELGYVDQTTYIDGGKAFTLQNGVNTTLPYKNIRIRGNAVNCPYGFEASVTFDTFSSPAAKGFYNVDVDIGAEDCWIGMAVGASEPTGIIDGSDLGSDLSVKVSAINCTKPQVIGRWCGGEFIANVVNTKSKSLLFKPLASDQDVIAQSVITGFYVRASLSGVMKEVDSKLKIGGGSNGGFGLSGATLKSDIENNLSSAFINSDEVVVVDFGGNTVANSKVRLSNVTDGTGTEIFTATNFVIYNESLKANIDSKSVKVKRDGQVWDTFRAEGSSDSIGIARLGSGAAGAADGFATVIDTLSGSTYKIQLYT